VKLVHLYAIYIIAVSLLQKLRTNLYVIFISTSIRTCHSHTSVMYHNG